MSPSLPIQYLSYNTIPDAKFRRDHRVWDFFVTHFPDIYNVLFGEDRRGVIFSSMIYQSSFPLMFGVIRKSYPLKVFRPIIKFIAVDMINCKSWFVSVYKSKTYQSMQKKPISLAAFAQGYAMISRTPKTWRYNLGRKFYSLPFPKPVKDRHSFFSSYAATIRGLNV